MNIKDFANIPHNILYTNYSLQLTLGLSDCVTTS